MPLKLQTPASAPVMTTAEAKMHLRVVTSDEDALIDAFVSAATLEAEHLMGRAVMPQKWLVTLDTFTPFIDLQRPPVTAVDSVKYLDAAGTLTTVAPSVYQLLSGDDYTAQLVPAFGQVWPTPRAQREAVQIVFSTGYANAAAVPELIKAWIRLQVGAMWENRESETMGQTYPLGIADRLLDRYRTWLS